MSKLKPEEREAVVIRIQVIDAKATELSRRAAFDGIKNWPAWDKLQQERTELEKKLWGRRPPDM